MAMQAYRAHYEKGHIVPLGKPAIPEGSELIVTVLERSMKNRAERQREAFRRFMTAMESAPPLSDEFDEIISRRVNIQREVGL
jgi:predicted DNA-binding antitoxin AbrB/MazE fold protein